MPFAPVEEQLALIRRGAVDVLTAEELGVKLERSRREDRPLRVKAGFDPTAPDLHVGHTVLLRKLRHFQDLGHTVIFLIGDFTGRIGDPTGRNELRKPMTRAQVQENALTYQDQVFTILDRDRTEVRFNSEWYQDQTFADVIELTSHMTVHRMLERDDFAKRYTSNQPISLVEFLYPLVQGYDSVALEADVELGGTDQKFNLLVGRDIQRAHGQEPQVVLTMPLLEGLDGHDKMSKSLGNHIGIAEPPDAMFGKTMRVSDELMWHYWELLTDVPLADLKAKRQAIADGQNPKVCKEELAETVVSQYHGAPAARRARDEFNRVHAQHELPSDMPETFVATDLIKPGNMVYLPLLMQNIGMVTSTGEARRLINQGSVRLNGTKIESATTDTLISTEDVLQVGRKRWARLIMPGDPAEE